MILEVASKRSAEISVLPEQRLEFLKRHLSGHDAVRLIVTEAADAALGNDRAPLAHCLTIEKRGKGFRVQDIAVDADRNFAVSEHLVTRLGRFVEVLEDRPTTTTSDLKAVLRDQRRIAHAPGDRYRNSSYGSVLDRLIVDEWMTNDVKAVHQGQQIEAHKQEFDFIMRRAYTALGQEAFDRLKVNALPHPLQNLVSSLVPLAKARAAQVQLSRTLNETGLAGFTFSGDDMM